MNDISNIAANRHHQILALLKEKDHVRVDELSKVLNVSLVTVRRDLDFLDESGLLVRTHGGAKKLDSPIQSEPERAFFEKGIANTDEKRKIARMAAGLVAPDEILFMNGGTTTLFFLEALKERVKVITNNAAAIVSERSPAVGLFVIGGQYREQSRSFVGELALHALKTIHSNATILGTNGISIDVGLTTSVLEECSLNQAMIRNTSGKVIVLADYSKLEHVSNFVSASLDDIDVVVTDDKAPIEFLDALRSRNIEVHIA